MPTATPGSWLDALRSRFAAQGLRVVRSLSAGALVDVLGTQKPSDVPFQGCLVVGDGGPDFFAAAAGFLADGEPDPLDRFTERIVTQTVVALLEPARIHYQLLFPFRLPRDGLAFVPFQRLGEAAGLPQAGPLGLQIHPAFGPWWGYRAAILIDRPVEDAAPLASPCLTCTAPCVAACPVLAVQRSGFDAHLCFSHRAIDNECQSACRARSACPVGEDLRYPESQLAYHMRAALALAFGRR